MKWRIKVRIKIQPTKISTQGGPVTITMIVKTKQTKVKTMANNNYIVLYVLYTEPFKQERTNTHKTSET